MQNNKKGCCFKYGV